MAAGLDISPLDIFNISHFTDNCTTETHSASVGTETPPLYQVPASGVTLLFVAYGTICIAALVGNLLVLWLVLPVRHMWTVTNVFLANLAVADIVISIFTIPFQFQAALLQRWNPPEFLCPVCPFVQALSVFVSVFTLSALAMYRYITTMYPFSMKISRCIALHVILLIWLLSFLFSLPTYLDYSVVLHHSLDISVVTPYCDKVGLQPQFRWYYAQFVVLSQYFVPLIIITGTYTQIAWTLWKSSDSLEDVNMLRRRRQVTKMMIGMLLLFGMCWFPYQTYNFLQIYVPSINDYPYINVVWFSIHWLAMSSSCYNPFIYAIYNANFRSEFRRRTAGVSFQYCTSCRRNYDSDEELYEMNMVQRII